MCLCCPLGESSSIDCRTVKCDAIVGRAALQKMSFLGTGVHDKKHDGWHGCRGEGWGRIYTDAMSMGLPVIATNWSAPTEYVDSSVGYPLEIEGLVTCAWDRRSEWAQPSFRHLRELMRHVVGHPEEVALKGLAARARMQERYAPEVVARKVVSRLQTISSQLSKHQRKAAD